VLRRGALRITPWLPALALVASSASCHRDARDQVGPDDPLAAAAMKTQPFVSPVDPAPAPRPRCVNDAWTTYGHDAARTSASGGCLAPPLRSGWSFRPGLVKGAPSHASRAVVTADAVYISGIIGPTPSVWRLDPSSGAVTWTYLTLAEATREGWPTVAGSTVALIDDGVYVVDTVTGKGHRGELDAWGESLIAGDRLYAENDRYWDGYGLYVSAFDLDARLLWRRDYQALVRFFTAPDVGGLAMDAGKLVHAAEHGPLKTTGLSAFDPASSERVWRAEVWPQSSPSIADGRVYDVERWKGESKDRLVARRLEDGAVVWSREQAGARGPAPVLAAGLVVVHARDAVVAFDRATGAPAWSAPVPRTAEAVQAATTIAAATGSGTLVALSGGSIHLLDLATGSESWSTEAAPHARRAEGPVIAGGSLFVTVDSAVMRFDSAPDAL
jgi:outer membrane protein assembly factor BamB